MDYIFNAVVTYSCKSGYKLVGNIRRRCNESGEWEGPDPVCKPVSCGRLTNPANGRVRATVITFQAEATYECDEGYQLQVCRYSNFELAKISFLYSIGSQK